MNKYIKKSKFLKYHEKKFIKFIKFIFIYLFKL